MKKTLMTTVAVATVVGFAAIASAQTMEGQSKGAMSPQGGQEQKVTPSGTSGAPMQKPAQKPIAQSGEKTTGQSAQAPAAKPEQRVGQEQQKQMAPQKGAPNEQSTVQENNKPGMKASDESASKASTSRAASVQLSQDQRSKIQDTIGRNSSARVTTSVNFDIAIGASVPRNVHVEVLPEDVVEIVPQYEGFDYIIVGDNILIIDPNTMEIVATIPA
jgi:Protein of unknown function (DUF1236)